MLRRQPPSNGGLGQVPRVVFRGGLWIPDDVPGTDFCQSVRK